MAPASTQDFEVWATAISARYVGMVAVSIGAALVVFWPTDWVFFAPGSPQREVFGLVRPPVIAMTGLVVLALWRVDWARRHPSVMVCLLSVGATLSAAVALEQVPHNGLDLLFVYSGYLLPFGTLALVVPPRRRIALTLGLSATCAVVLVAAHPGLLDPTQLVAGSRGTGTPPGGPPAVIIGFSCLFSIALGHVLYTLLRTNHEQRTELARNRDALTLLNESMAQKLESRAADVSRLVSELDRSVEDERRHISRELHDELGQLLTGLRIELALAQARVDDPAAIRNRLGRLDQHLELALEALVRIVRGLRPRAIDELGLIEAAQSLVSAFSRRSRIPCQLSLDRQSLPQPLGLDGEAATQVYRILQESLTNVTRHAEASRVDVALSAVGGRLYLSVQDDGKGFEAGAGQSRSRHGLIGMRERAQSLGGLLTVESAPGAGTTVRLDVPLCESN